MSCRLQVFTLTALSVYSAINSAQQIEIDVVFCGRSHWRSHYSPEAEKLIFGAVLQRTKHDFYALLLHTNNLILALTSHISHRTMGSIFHETGWI